MNKNAFLQSLPIVAQAMSDKLGVRVSVSGNTAYTDGNSINLPVLPDDSRLKSLARGYLDHEAAHVRFTDFKPSARNALHHSLRNAIEDHRIEVAMSELFPGCRINLRELNEQLLKDGLFGVPASDSHPARIIEAYVMYSQFVRLQRLNAFQDVFEQTQAVARQVFPEGALIRLEGILSGVASLQSTQETTEMAAEILEMIEEEANKEPEQQSPEQQPGQQSDQDGDDQDDDQGDANPSASDDAGNDGNQQSESSTGNQPGEDNDGGNASDNQSSTSEGAETGNDQSESEGENQNGASSNSESEGSATDGDARGTQGSSSAPGGQQDDAAKREKLREALSASQGDLDTDKAEKIAETLSDNAVSTNTSVQPMLPRNGDWESVHASTLISEKDVSRETNALTTRLNALMQANKMQRTAPRRVGRRIDTRYISRLARGDMRVFQARQEKQKVNTAVHVLLDRSISMRYGGRMDIANHSTLAAALALNMLQGVSLGITAFPGESGNQTATLLKHSEPLRANIQHLETSPEGGYTPLGEALWKAMAELIVRDEDRKIIIAITDGDANGSEDPELVVPFLENMGLEVMAIGIETDYVKRAFRNNRVIQNAQELPSALFEMLQSQLLNQAV